MKSILMKLLVLAVCAAMLLSLFACDGGNKETEAPTDEKTEAPTDEKTEAPTQKETEAPTQKETEAPTQKETEAPTQGSEAPTTDESESGEAPSESESTAAPTESESGEAPSESTSETTSEEKPTESETKPEEKPTESETKPEEKPTESETKPEEKPTESETKPEEKPTEPEKPTCDGNHPYKDRGDQGHYQDACEICGIERVLEEHDYEIVDGKPTCKVCNYVASCQGVHAWETDAEGHWINKCLTCGAEGIEKAGHTGATVEGKYICTVCKIELPCPETHKVLSDAEGHWTEACDVCGAAATDKVPHSETGADYVTETAYVYGCADCGYAYYTKALTDKVAAIITPGNMHNAEPNAEKGNLSSSTKYQLATELVFNDIPYATMSSTGEVSQYIWNRHLGDVASRSAYEEYTFDIGQAKYLVIKARATMAETSQIVLNFSTAGKDGYNGVIIPLVKATENAEWVTYVIDLEKAYGANYAKAEGAETYVVDTFYFHMQPFTTTDVLDIAYMAFVEGEWADVAANVEAETAIRVTASNAGTEVDVATGNCIGEHAYVATVVDGYYKSVCACGATKDSYGVKAEGPDAFWSAESINGWVAFTGTADKEVRYDDDETAYIRFSNTKVNKDNWSAFQWTNSGSAATGQYMIMKFRIGENGLGQTNMWMYINSKGSEAAGNNWTTGSVDVKVSEDGKWHYLVIDLANRVKEGGFMPNDDGTYTVNYFSVRYFHGYQTLAQADDYMDVSYVAFCDSIDDVKNIVDAETYELSVDNSTNALRNTADNTCAAHAWTEEVSGTTHTLKCTLCGEISRTFEVSADINWYASLSGMNKFQHSIEKMLFDEEEGVMFNRYTGTGGNHLNLTGGGGAGSATSGTFTTGKYVAIKHRLWVAGGDTATGTFGFNVATGDKKSGNGASMGTLNYTSINQGEWRVAIMDVSSNAQWTSDGTAQSIYMMITTGGSGAYTFDVAWVAVVDSIDEMKLLLQEDETYYDLGNSWNGTPVHYYQDGTKVPCDVHAIAIPTVTDGENGAKVYSYKCPSCDAVYFEKTVPAGVIYMSPDVLKTTKAATIVNPNAESANSPEVYAEKAGLNPTNPYNHKNATYAFDTVPYYGYKGGGSGNVAQFIWNRAYADYTSNAPSTDRYLMDMGEAKYLVFKLRTNLAEANSAFDLSISTTGASGKSIKLPIYANQTDGWVTYVIDLETVIPDNWVKDEETGHYIMDSFYYTNYSFTADNSIDIAYIAFVEGGWAELDALVDEDTVVNVIGATDFTYDVRYTDGTLVGTKAEDPIDVMFDENMSASVTVPANTTFYFSSWGLSNGMILKANGEELEFVAGSMMLRTPSTFSITNATDAPVTYALTVEFAEGTFENPAELVKGDNVIEFAEGAQNYYLTWTATESGKITLTFSANTGWYYVVNRTYNGSYPDMFDADGDGDTEELIYDRITNYGDGQWSDSDPVVNTVVIEVEEGDVISIEVCTYDPENAWAAPAGTVTVNAEWGNDDPYVLTIEEAIELGLAQAHNTYTDDWYYVTGVITKITSATSYGNLYIVDEEGNEFLIYGSYNEDGSVQYGSMTVKPVVGDTVTVYGPVGQYSGTAQIKNGWIMSFVSHTCNFSAADCENDSACTICGAKGTETALGHIDVDPADGICDRCEADLNAEATELVITAEKLGLGDYKAGTAEIDGIEFAFTELGDYGNGIQMRIKNGNTASIGNIIPTEKKIARIELVYNSDKSTYDNANAFTFTFGTEENETAYTTNLDTVKGTKTYTVTPDTEDYTIFTMTLNLTYTFYWDSITIVYAD